MPDGHLAACVCSRATITRAQNAPAGAPRLMGVVTCLTAQICYVRVGVR
jgi:hypothetical protein